MLFTLCRSLGPVSSPRTPLPRVTWHIYDIFFTPQWTAQFPQWVMFHTVSRKHPFEVKHWKHSVWFLSLDYKPDTVKKTQRPDLKELQTHRLILLQICFLDQRSSSSHFIREKLWGWKNDSVYLVFFHHHLTDKLRFRHPERPELVMQTTCCWKINKRKWN